MDTTIKVTDWSTNITVLTTVTGLTPEQIEELIDLS